jgi:hypothetical protein
MHHGEDEVDNIAKHLPEDCAQTESARHDTPQQAAASDHPDPVEIVPCMAAGKQLLRSFSKHWWLMMTGDTHLELLCIRAWQSPCHLGKQGKTVELAVLLKERTLTFWFQKQQCFNER